MFLQVDKTWKEIMRKVQRIPNAMRAATQPGKCPIYKTFYIIQFIHILNNQLQKNYQVEILLMAVQEFMLSK